jgi:putative ATP-binding cassette transporter
MERRRTPFSYISWSRLRASIRALATSDVGGRAGAMFAALFVLLLAINGLNVINSYVGRDFMTAIQSRSMSGFLSMALLYVGVFAVSTITAVGLRFVEERLGLLWREWLTRRLVGNYLAGDTYYWLREHSAVSNPDQRIAEDVRTFTTTSLSLMLVFLNATFTIIAFSGVMWSISPMLFATAIGYAALGSVLTVLFGKPLIWLNYNQFDREAALRAELVHLREHAESVAILEREGRIGSRVHKRIDDLVENTARIIAVNRNLGFFTTGYNYLIQIIPVLIVAPLFMRGSAEFGVVTQSAMAFSHLIGAFSLIVTQFQQISSYAVVLSRLGSLRENVEQVTSRVESGIQYDDGAGALSWTRLTLRSPLDAALLVDSLTLTVPHGRRLLITGPNEAARIALFRATAGLWKHGEGRIGRPPNGSVLFVPERPYLPPGTLRQALVRTNREDAVDDTRIREVLRALGLPDRIVQAESLDVELDWDDMLSLAEQQLVVFARVLLATPRFALLDRPDTLFEPDAMARVLVLLAKHDITTVTFAPGRALASRHDACLQLAKGGTWSWETFHETKGLAS